VACYPSPDNATAMFRQLDSSLQECVALHNAEYDFVLDKPDPNTLRLTDHQWCHLYRVKSAVLISVGAVGLQASDQVASTVLQTITDRVK
ncbi:lipoprotein LpqQ, partial [Mycobacterium rhizamassiliense]